MHHLELCPIGRFPLTTYFQSILNVIVGSTRASSFVPDILSKDISEPWWCWPPLSDGQKGPQPTHGPGLRGHGRWHGKEVCTTCSHSLLVPSGPVGVWDLWSHFYLVLDCQCMCLILWLGGPVESCLWWASLTIGSWSLDVLCSDLYKRPITFQFLLSEWYVVCCCYCLGLLQISFLLGAPLRGGSLSHNRYIS